MFRGKKWAELLPGSRLPRLRSPQAKRKLKYPLSVKRPRPEPDVRPWKTILPDGREILDKTQKEGWREYRARVKAMLERQGGVCCLSRDCPLCPGQLRLEEAVFEHERGRGMGGAKRDDRILDSEGLPLNGAAHYQCNRWKGSRSVSYNRP